MINRGISTWKGIWILAVKTKLFRVLWIGTGVSIALLVLPLIVLGTIIPVDEPAVAATRLEGAESLEQDPEAITHTLYMPNLAKNLDGCHMPPGATFQSALGVRGVMDGISGAIATTNNRIYRDEDGQLVILEILESGGLLEIGRGPMLGSIMTAIEVEDMWIHVSIATGRILTFDARDPKNIRQVSCLHSGSPALAMLRDGDFLLAYINFEDEREILAIDVEDPLAPSITQRLEIDRDWSPLAKYFQKHGDKIFVGDYFVDDLMVLDFKKGQLRNPRMVFEGEWPWLHKNSTVHFSKDRVWIWDDSVETLHAMDLSETGMPSTLGSVQLKIPAENNQPGRGRRRRHLSIRDEKLYLIEDIVRDGDGPTEEGSFTVLEYDAARAMDALRQGDPLPLRPIRTLESYWMPRGLLQHASFDGLTLVVQYRELLEDFHAWSFDNWPSLGLFDFSDETIHELYVSQPVFESHLGAKTLLGPKNIVQSSRFRETIPSTWLGTVTAVDDGMLRTGGMAPDNWSELLFLDEEYLFVQEMDGSDRVIGVYDVKKLPALKRVMSLPLNGPHQLIHVDAKKLYVFEIDENPTFSDEVFPSSITTYSLDENSMWQRLGVIIGPGISLPINGQSAEVLLQDSILLANAIHDRQESAWLLDLSDPSQISFTAKLAECDWNLRFMTGEMLLFCLNGRRRLEAVDVSDPANPKNLGASDLSDVIDEHQPFASENLAVAMMDGDELILAGSGIHVFDVSDPSSVRYAYSLNSSSYLGHAWMRGFSKIGQFGSGFAAIRWRGLHAQDIFLIEEDVVGEP